MKNSITLIKLGTAVVILAIVVAYVLQLNRIGTSEFTRGYGDLEIIVSDMAESDFRPYINSQVTGDFVISIIGKYRTVYPIKVCTGVVPTGFYNMSQIYDSKSEMYINPRKTFIFYTGENSQGETEILMFVQAGLTREDMDPKGIYAELPITKMYDLDAGMAYMGVSKDAEIVAKKESAIRAQKEELNNLIKKYSEICASNEVVREMGEAEAAAADGHPYKYKTEESLTGEGITYGETIDKMNEEYKEVEDKLDAAIYGGR